MWQPDTWVHCSHVRITLRMIKPGGAGHYFLTPPPHQATWNQRPNQPGGSWSHSPEVLPALWTPCLETFPELLLNSLLSVLPAREGFPGSSQGSYREWAGRTGYLFSASRPVIQAHISCHLVWNQGRPRGSSGYFQISENSLGILFPSRSQISN